MKYVQAKIRQFKRRFKDLKKDVRQSLIKSKISVEKVIVTLKSLFADDDMEHKYFSESQLEVFNQAIDHSMLLGQLDFYMDYLSYYLLDYLITEYGLEDVRAQMECYKSDLQQLQMKTPLSMFSELQRRNKMRLSDFEELVIEYNSTVSQSEDVDTFSRAYQAHYGLKDCSMILARIQSCYSTFTCSWFIPKLLVEKLKERFFQEISRGTSLVHCAHCWMLYILFPTGKHNTKFVYFKIISSISN